MVATNRSGRSAALSNRSLALRVPGNTHLGNELLKLAVDLKMNMGRASNPDPREKGRALPF